MKKKFLVCVDITNEFTTGVLGSAAAAATIPLATAAIAEYKKLGYDIIFLQDTHGDNYLQTQEGRHLPIKHGKEGSFGWKIVRQVLDAAKEDAKFILKPAFGAISLLDHLQETVSRPNEDIEEIIVIGLVTDICVISNVLLLKAAFPEVKISVIANCCAGLTEQKHIAALDVMRSCQVNII
ncbi:MAG: cysteine hydrolase [Clostridiales bacterium]|nr:cysteine hydrolase [Clostridiales bacterium]